MNHRPGCTFGHGFFRIELRSGERRFCRDEQEVEQACALLTTSVIRRVVRDGYCMDDDHGESPDVIQGERFLAMSKTDAMEAMGGISEAEYLRAYRAIEDAVLARDRAISGGAIARPSIVIKKKGRRVADVAALQVPR